MTSIQNESTGEVITFTDDQVLQILQAAPDDYCKVTARQWLNNNCVSVLNSDGFHFIAYLCTRAWLGLGPDVNKMHA